MIAIVNVGPHDDPDPTFTHKRDHGLVQCLRIAAAAVEDVRAKELQAAYFGEGRE